MNIKKCFLSVVYEPQHTELSIWHTHSFSGSNETRLVSPVISSALLCDGDIVCDTSSPSLTTDERVRIELAHDDQVL